MAHGPGDRGDGVVDVAHAARVERGRVPVAASHRGGCGWGGLWADVPGPAGA